MIAAVTRGRIRLTFPDDLHQREIDQILLDLEDKIGSVRQVEKHPRELSCALSHHNFRKLRIYGCDLSKDKHTEESVAKIRKQLDTYLEESKRATDVKKGREVFKGYKFKLPPYEHQKLAFQFLHAMPRVALFGDCGVGKTNISVTYADSCLKAGMPMAFIVVCPVNLIQHVWLEDAAKFSDLNCVGLREPTSVSLLRSDFDDPKDPPMERMEQAKVRAERADNPAWKKKAKRVSRARYKKKLDKRFEADADMYIINPENMRTDPKEKRLIALCKRLLKEGKTLCLIIDESSKIKSRTSRIYKSMMKVRMLSSNCIIMTGTPSPNGVTDLWAQFSLLDGGMTLQPSFADYRKDVAEEFSLKNVTYTDHSNKKREVVVWHQKKGAAKQVYNTIEPRMIRFKTEDCIDLPPQRFLIRYVDMSVEQAEFYADMEDRLYGEIENEPVTAKVAVAKLMKLREVTGGFVINDAGKSVPFNKNSPKMLELDTLLEQSIAKRMGDSGPPFKALIWAQYKWECKTLVERYSKKYGARGLFGGISSGAKDRNISAFKNSPDCQVLVCHPASVGHGLTLIEANFAFYYSLSYNYEEFYQSYRRIARPGQKRAMTIYLLVAPNTIDEDLIDTIQSKKNVSDVITDGEFDRRKFLDTRGTSGGQLQLEL